jgi:hypothetical protein
MDDDDRTKKYTLVQDANSGYVAVAKDDTKEITDPAQIAEVNAALTAAQVRVDAALQPLGVKVRVPKIFD